MENEKQVAVVEKSALVSMEFNSEQVELIKTTVAKGTNNNQLALFLYTCKRTGLDPLAKQIHCIVRNTKNGPVMSIQTAIDGYRLVADRSGQYAGNDDPIYDDEKNPKKATVTVYKLVAGIRCPFTATARWEQYYPGDLQGFMWKKMPHLMLGKCAEALALRKAFPAELSGIYTHEEMQQAENEPQKHSHQPATHSSADPTPEQLEETRKAKAAEYGKDVKDAPAKPQTPPNSDKQTIDGQKTAIGFLKKQFPPNKGGYSSFTLEDYEDESGKSLFFATNDSAIIETLAGKLADGEKTSFTYNTVINGKYTNRMIVEVLTVQEKQEDSAGVPF